jgi:FMN phosphatase YigB (HAD superfamily)
MSNRSIDFKIAVFDLDQTLWDGRKLYSDVRNILETLRKGGISMYVASFHTDAANVCKELGIGSFFKKIHYGIEKNKLEMIREILIDIPEAKESDVAFFDDNYENIKLVKKETDIRCIHVVDSGITWYHINIACIKLYKFIGELYKVDESSTVHGTKKVDATYEFNWLQPSVDLFNDDGFHLDNFALLSKLAIKNSSK